MTFATQGDSHQHSLETLNQLYEHDDFMYSITSVVDLGCGLGDDLKWWGTRTTRDTPAEPLKIQCRHRLDRNLALDSTVFQHHLSVW